MKLPKIYQPSLGEADIYALWKKSGAFQPKSASSGEVQPYAIVMPPPNANANLHIGTELTFVLEDIAARYHRLKGDNVLLLPGADHAGFETQSVFEKQLAKDGKSRFDFSREDLYQQIWDFVALNKGNIEAQYRRMGVSCDWNRFTFTLDDKIVKRAYATFQKMWDEGLIYRGERLVNFCTFHGTAFADIEVVYKEEAGKLWYIRYPLSDGSGEVIIATTRPETMLGDTAVAVHPDDVRYKKYIGKSIILPLTKREIPIIADDFVERDFGTGAVKITPAHDQNDYDAAERHDLPKLTVIDHEGKINHPATPAYHDLSVLDARAKIVQDLTEQGLLDKTEDLTHNVGHCYKCDTVIQPLLREQWFVDMKPLAKQAIAALEAGSISFYPGAKQDQLISYLKSLRDWNISRQIAWGIPIPAFQNVDQPDDWIYDERVDQEIITIGDKTYHRDPDVFDTWFSSSSWPYATLNYGAADDSDFKQFYPLGLLETGGEILYPWVSRMIMLGLYVTGEVPFKAVYIHGYVMAADGSKMSKSVGNVVNPIPVIDEFGSDALRIGIIAGRSPAVNRGYDPRKVADGRNFCNKLWNVARYIEDRIGSDYVKIGAAVPNGVTDHWILAKLQLAADQIDSHLQAYRFSEAYETLYHFVWDDFADWYIEASKSAPNHAVLAHCLTNILKLTHPFAPFMTETIWQTLAWENASILANQTWPDIASFDSQQGNDFEELKTIVSECRFISKALGVSGRTLYYSSAPLLQDNAELIGRLAHLSAVHQAQEGSGLFLTSTQLHCWLDIDDTAAAAYRTQLTAKKTAQTAIIARLEGRLANEAYVRDAPTSIVEQTRTQLSEARQLLENIDREAGRFQVS